MKRCPDEKSFSFRHIFHYLGSTEQQQFTKPWICFLWSSSREELPSRGLSVSAWLKVQWGKAHGQFNGTRALHEAPGMSPSAPVQEGFSASSALSGCNT